MNNIISQNQEKIKNTQRYIPLLLETGFYAVKTYRSGNSVSYVCRRYKISKASLMRWNKKFDGTIDSLRDKSHRPLSKHPKSHTDTEIYWIKNYIRRNPNITMIELFSKLKVNKGYDRHPCSLFRILRKLGFFKEQQKVVKPYVPKPYDTPTMFGIKMQMDVKYFPKHCYVGKYPDSFFQYTMIDEATGERFIYAFKEHSSYSTVVFVKMAIEHFGYIPKIIQTDNGFEFTHFKDTKRIHPLDKLCNELGIKHQLIRPRTPRHNGKVERSHRNDNKRFYRNLSFYSYEDLNKQMKRYLYRSNRLPMQTLNWLSPIEKRKQLMGN